MTRSQHTASARCRRAALIVVVCGAAAVSGCRSTPTEVEVEIRSVGVDHTSGSPVVVLQDKEHRLALPIWIGPSEAQAIAVQMEGISPPRPMTHDLMKTVLDEVGVTLDRVVIGELKDNTYFARLHLQSGRKGLEVDSRPSDAIALAVRFKKPIFVSQALLQGETGIDLTKIVGADTVSLRGLTVQALSAQLAEYFDLPPGHGVLVAEVTETVKDVQRGDVIVSINGAEVAGLGDFSEKLKAVGSAPARIGLHRAGRRLEIALASPTP